MWGDTKASTRSRPMANDTVFGRGGYDAPDGVVVVVGGRDGGKIRCTGHDAITV